MWIILEAHIVAYGNPHMNSMASGRLSHPLRIKMFILIMLWKCISNFMLSCVLSTTPFHKGLLPLFRNVVLGFFKFSSNLDHQVDSSLYVTEATPHNRYSRV